MKYLSKYFFVIPILFLVIELIYLLGFSLKPRISPYSDNNRYLTDLVDTLRLSGLNYQQLNLFDHRHEVEVVIVDKPTHSFKTIISTQLPPLSQVAALQKLIKIANIEGRELSFVDLSSRRPYATF
ncbi:MAG: hypothetical protein WC851_05405 [Candidatus Shapirobacteria bacterium]|jgi:hypothetical protein